MNDYSMPHLHVAGNHYQVGFQIGKEFKQRIETYMKTFTKFNTHIVPFIKTENARKVIESYMATINHECPWYMSELQGLAAGSEIDFDHILALNLRCELINLITMTDSTAFDKECTDFHFVTNDQAFLVHNEDSSPAVLDTAYIVSCKISSWKYNTRDSPSEEFTAYCFPGHLPGNAFGFNTNGFCLSLNANYAERLRPSHTLPRQFLNRMTLSVECLNDLESMLVNKPCSYGFSINVAYFGDDRSKLESSWTNQCEYSASTINIKPPSVPPSPITFNYELSFNDENDANESTVKVNRVSKACVIADSVKLTESCDSDFYARTFYAHYNDYQRFEVKEIRLYILSSIHRRHRVNELPQPRSLHDILELASDTGDQEYPIYRTPRVTDASQTTATGVFDLKKKLLLVYLNKPSESNGPSIVLKMDKIY